MDRGMTTQESLGMDRSLPTGAALAPQEAPAVPGQLALDLEPLVVPEGPGEGTLQQQFEAFHQANPWVLEALESLTRDWLANGHKRLGIGMLWEVVRYQYGRTVSEDFKANNNHRSRYVRLMIERHPEWAEVFATRELRAA